MPWVVPLAAAGFGLTLLALVVADVDTPVRLALLATFVLSAVLVTRQLRRVGGSRVLAWDGRGGWTLDGHGAAVSPATRVHPGLVVLVLRKVPGVDGAQARRGPRWLVARATTTTVWIPRSAAAPDSFRRLKQQLRLGRTEPAAEPPENPPC